MWPAQVVRAVVVLLASPPGDDRSVLLEATLPGIVDRHPVAQTEV